MTFTHCVEICRQKAIERMADVDEPEVFAVCEDLVVVTDSPIMSTFFVLKSGSENFLPRCTASLGYFTVNVVGLVPWFVPNLMRKYLYCNHTCTGPL